MNTTDEERRKVAHRLRNVEAIAFDEGELCDCGDVECELGLDTSDGAWYTADSVLRLANLIDRPTCHMESVHIDHGHATWGIRCDACNEYFENELGTGWNHCPSCGAEVVRNG